MQKNKVVITVKTTQNCVINYIQFILKKTLDIYEKPLEHKMKFKHTRSR